jgi:DNA-binding NtrC family response regulator
MGSFREYGPATHSPRLLVLDQDTRLAQALARTLELSIPDLNIETASSPDHAKRRLALSPYQAIVCSPTLTVAGGSSILTCSRWIEPAVPFLLALKSDEREFAQQWLDLGVYDFIFSPVDPGQALESVRQALLLSKHRGLIARKKHALAELRRRRERYQAGTSETPLRHQTDALLKSSILRIQESTGSLEHTARRIEASLERLQRTCRHNEQHARQRALTRLSG